LFYNIKAQDTSPRDKNISETFKVFQESDEQGNNLYYVGIELKVAGWSVRCPLTEGAEDYSEVIQHIVALQQSLEGLKEKIESKISISEKGVSLDFPPETPPQEIWNRLCEIEEEEAFVKGFNSLPADQRAGVADYVLTHCNIFSGRAAAFSARYDNETGLME